MNSIYFLLLFYIQSLFHCFTQNTITYILNKKWIDIISTYYYQYTPNFSPVQKNSCICLHKRPNTHCTIDNWINFFRSFGSEYPFITDARFLFRRHQVTCSFAFTSSLPTWLAFYQAPFTWNGMQIRQPEGHHYCYN